jgi:ElaB/YqjD/DUF883 family membrane-anchored ribosome-binding protein
MNTKSITRLMDDVQELLAELQDEHAPEVQELRDRVEASLNSAQRAIGKQGTQVAARLGQYASSVDGYITDYPRLAFLSGAVLFGTIGYLTGAMSRERQ